jgi:hypothetical protein
MSNSKKDKLSEVSILERYRKLKGERSASDLSQKIMEITRAGRKLAGQQDICILCDRSDYCTTCDATDLFCVLTDDNDWCFFSDSCDLVEDILEPELRHLST